MSTVCPALSDHRLVGTASSWSGPQPDLFGTPLTERGRGRSLMATQDEGWRRAKDIVLHREWNRYEIRAEGNRVRLTLNGKVTFEGTDDRTKAGIVAIQLHAGPAMQVECRSIRIKPL